MFITAVSLLGYNLLRSRDTLQSPLPDHAESVFAQGAGRLAYIGADGNIYVTTPELEEHFAVTQDATAPPEGPGLSYPRVSWSPDGQLAYASVIRDGNEAQARLYVADAPDAPARLVGHSDQHFVIYIYWSPTPCPEKPECSRLSYLIEEPEGIALHIVDMGADGTSNEVVGYGWPFYYSWSPDGKHMLWHTGGSARFNEEARISRFSIKNQQTDRLNADPGLFIAPAWSPLGDEWLLVTTQDEHDQLVRSQASQTGNLDREKILATAEGKHMVYSWSPGGDRVAYSILRNSDGLIFGPIHVYDLETGETEQITSPSFDISGFFWSPDGKRIGYLSRLALRDETWMQWRVFDLTQDVDRGFAAFNPSYQMRYVVSSFNQYAQSHRLWSPDGRYLVYADQDDARVERIWMVDTFAERGTDPILVAEGSMGFWSFE
ncbi:MAG: DPP IV N-terminal domain-containing protein [Anaerolineales bacterium]